MHVRKQQFRHYTGLQLWTFFDPFSTREYQGPRQYLEYLAETGSNSQNTIKAKANALKSFLDFLGSCSEVLEGRQPINAPGKILSRILMMYPVYLAEADMSPNSFVVAVAKRTGFGGVSKSSVASYLSAINGFISFSDIEWIGQQALDQDSVVDLFVDEGDLMAELRRIDHLSSCERISVVSRSMLAGVISGGPKQIPRPVLAMPKRFKASESSDLERYEKAFPASRIVDLIKHASSYRDVCLFSLLAGTGVRTSEALQLRLEDIDAINEVVKILPYAERIQKYGDLSDHEKTKLAFKGRASSDVVFLEPFRSYFFDNLMRYMDRERGLAYPGHNFLFVTLANNRKGNPMFLGDACSNNRTFKKTQNKLGIAPSYSLHSLRHFYGVWLRNFAPHSHGYGYPLSVVQRAMGHQSIKSTEIYSLLDKLVYLEFIEATNHTLKALGFDFERVRNEASKDPTLIN
ncbi:tyrosine-type recombinase/integrase [Marinagarivorans cellulosilyticus]|uniref:Integrase/recombinase XerD n=1 Tax=Marinagarivorans cellulosilyticus TaxID=2721545 RepID=A0AAN1WEW7_9GAMM|nr:site-specific integrase [Marinagarivorans cellulosilyticus]BCD96338.1 integrase/recombinase XerD [Marinagarivorans cellulosilyticus]